jgi:hypothetical protein
MKRSDAALLIDGAIFRGTPGSPRFVETSAALQPLGFHLVRMPGRQTYLAAPIEGQMKLALETIAALEAEGLIP